VSSSRIQRAITAFTETLEILEEYRTLVSRLATEDLRSASKMEKLAQEAAILLNTTEKSMREAHNAKDSLPQVIPAKS